VKRQSLRQAAKWAFAAFLALACAGLEVAQAPARAQSPQAPSSSAQATTAPPAAAARFNFHGNAAEIPADFVDNIPFLPVSVDHSRPSYFVLDTTANVSSIDPQRAAELGIASAQPVTLNLNGVDIPLAVLAQQPSPNFGAKIGRAYEGTLGNDFLQQVVVEIDYGRLTVRLYDPSAYKYSGRGKSAPLTFAGGIPIVQAKFTEPRGKTLESGFVINTALDASAVISTAYADAHKLLRAHWKTIPTLDPDLDPNLAAAPGALLGRSKGFQLGPYFAEDALVTFSKLSAPAASDPRVAGEIGAGLLRRFKVVLDYPHHQLILEPSTNFTPEEEEDKSGLAVIAKGPNLKTFEIAEVAPNTPAASAGLQKGDVIAGIDEDAAADLTLYEIRDLFRQTGHQYTLLIERNGQDKKVTLEMHRFL
jgi:hypothetical protein